MTSLSVEAIKLGDRKEIEVTPEMIEAGLEALWGYDLMHPCKDELRGAVKEVFTEMVRVNQKSLV